MYLYLGIKPLVINILYEQIEQLWESGNNLYKNSKILTKILEFIISLAGIYPWNR